MEICSSCWSIASPFFCFGENSVSKTSRYVYPASDVRFPGYKDRVAMKSLVMDRRVDVIDVTASLRSFTKEMGSRAVGMSC